MNVYKKLQTCRKELKALPIKESGNNKFAGYTYMELGDFLPHIVDLCEAHALCTVISFADMATLTIINSDKPEEQIVFTSPMSTAELKGCHAIQNLGAVETYLRRYLYVAAFDIVEHDALDSTNGKDERKANERYETGKDSGKSGTETAKIDPKDAEYHTRIQTALKTIHGDNKNAALDQVEELTSFIPRGKTEADRVKGVRNFLTLKGDRAKFLAEKLDKLAIAKVDKPKTCHVCASILGEDGKCPETSCSTNEIPF
jgi:hypothetical protein